MSGSCRMPAATSCPGEWRAGTFRLRALLPDALLPDASRASSAYSSRACCASLWLSRMQKKETKVGQAMANRVSFGRGLLTDDCRDWNAGPKVESFHYSIALGFSEHSACRSATSESVTRLRRIRVRCDHCRHDCGSPCPRWFLRLN